MTNQQKQPVSFYDSLYNSFLNRLEAAGHAKRLQWCLISLGIAVALIVLASLPLHLNVWLNVLIGFPAGVLLFGNLVAALHFTTLADSGLADYKDRVPPSRRIRSVVIAIIIVAIILITLKGYVPQGVGGTIVILVALTAYNLIRRTPEEIRLAIAGLPDPRELPDEDETDTSEEENQS